MQLNARFVVHRVLDNSEKTLVSALADRHSLANQLVTAERSSWWWHGIRVPVCACVKSRVDTAEIRTLRLSTTALCRHGDDVVTADHKDTLVLDKLTVPDKECTPVNVQNLALSPFTAVLLNVVLMSDFRSVAIGRYCVFVSADNL